MKTSVIALSLLTFCLLSEGKAQTGAGKAFATIAEGSAATKEGGDFLVPQKNGEGAYRYKRTATGVMFEGVELYGSNAEKRTAQRAEEAKAPAPASGLVSHLWGSRAWEWDGRVIPNEVATSTPTLNLVPDPFDPANESESAEPAKEQNTAATTDPLGGNHAEKLTFSAPQQPLVFSSGQDVAFGPWGTPIGVPLRARIWAKSLSGPLTYTFGLYGSKTELTTDWKEYKADFTPSGPKDAISFSNGAENTNGVAAIAGAAIYDEFAGENLPDLKSLLDDQNGAHGTMPLRVPGAIAFTPEGAIDNAKMKAGVRVFTGPDMPETKAYTLGIWISPDQIKDTSYGTAISISTHPNDAGKYNMGMLGVYSDLGSAIERRGRLRPFPTNNNGYKRTGQYFIEQGWQHIAITVNNGVTTPYINGIPIYEMNADNWKPQHMNAFSIGYYMPALLRQNSNRYLPGRWQGAYVARKALTDEEILQMDRHGRARLPAIGITPAKRHMVAFGMGAGVVAKPESWWWHLCQNYDLTPRLHGHLEGQNAGALPAWSEPKRLAFFTRQVLAAADSYDEVWCFVPSGGSDENLWASNGYDIAEYKKQFQEYLQKLKAIHPKVRIAVATALPRSQGSAAIKTEQARMAWNEDLRANSKEMGIDQLLDIGLGTKRIDAQGVVTDETRPGGTLMGNWQVVRASVAHQRKPATALNLSATSGDAITATAPAGTFTQEDVYRRVVSGAGSAQITAVNGDGSQATLSTQGYTPKRGKGEGEDQVARDSIVRGAFATASLAQDAWSVENDPSYYINGTDQTQPGGRILGDLVAPIVQELISSSGSKSQ